MQIMLWNIKGLMCDEEAEDGFSFTIWVSPRFLKIAEKVELDDEIKKRFQDVAREIIRKAGYKDICDSENFLKFGEFGLVSFNLPSSAVGMYMEWDNYSDIFKRGAEFVSHNVSSSLYQSALLKIWLIWAKYIESLAKEKVYFETITAFRSIIKNNCPEVAAEQQEDNRNAPSHLLWMLEQIEKSNFDSDKAGRWIGWVAHSIYLKGWLSSQEIDSLIGSDI